MTSSKEIKYFLDGVEVSKQNWGVYGCSEYSVTTFDDYISVKCSDKRGHSTRHKAVKENVMKPLEEVKKSKTMFDYISEHFYLKPFENMIESAENLKHADTTADFKPNERAEEKLKVLNEHFDYVLNGMNVPEKLHKSVKESVVNNLKEDGFFKESGKKDNSFKLPMSILFKQFPRALQAVVLASCYGHNKYKDTDSDFQNFRRVGGETTYLDAHLRHQLDKEIYGEKDLESGLHHLFHEAFNKLAEVELYLEGNKIDIKEYAKEYLKRL